MSKKCALPRSFFPVKFKVRSPVHALQLARQLIRPYGHWVVGKLGVGTVVEEEKYVNYITGEQEAEKVEVELELDERDIKDPRAEAFCALGALLRVNTRHAAKAQDFLAQAAALIGGASKEEIAEGQYSDEDIFAVNDSDGSKANHKRVLQMFTKAIQLAKKAQAAR